VVGGSAVAHGSGLSPLFLVVSCSITTASTSPQPLNKFIWPSNIAHSCRICGTQNGIQAGFLRVLRFPYQFTFHQNGPFLLIIIQGWHNESLTAYVSRDCLIPPEEQKKSETGVHIWC
jgi:hypothetical protein